MWFDIVSYAAALTNRLSNRLVWFDKLSNRWLVSLSNQSNHSDRFQSKCRRSGGYLEIVYKHYKA
jgi:hypothetical protein